MEAGFVSQEPIRHRYFVSGKALEVSTGFLRHSPAYRAAFPVMHQLGSEIEGIVHFGVWDRDTILFSAAVGNRAVITSTSTPATAGPCTPVPWARQCWPGLPQPKWSAYMSEGCERFMENTITTLAAMH